MASPAQGDKQMSAAHTPAPWEAANSDEHHWVVSPPLNAPPAECGPWFTAIVQCVDADVEAANARLIAVSPRMYDLIKRIAEHFDGTDAPMGIEAFAILSMV
jgi:hypothetical protein